MSTTEKTKKLELKPGTFLVNRIPTSCYPLSYFAPGGLTCPTDNEIVENECFVCLHVETRVDYFIEIKLLRLKNLKIVYCGQYHSKLVFISNDFWKKYFDVCESS